MYAALESQFEPCQQETMSVIWFWWNLCDELLSRSTGSTDKKCRNSIKNYMSEEDPHWCLCWLIGVRFVLPASEYVLVSWMEIFLSICFCLFWGIRFFKSNRGHPTKWLSTQSQVTGLKLGAEFVPWYDAALIKDKNVLLSCSTRSREDE